MSVAGATIASRRGMTAIPTTLMRTARSSTPTIQTLCATAASVSILHTSVCRVDMSLWWIQRHRLWRVRSARLVRSWTRGSCAAKHVPTVKQGCSLLTPGGMPYRDCCVQCTAQATDRPLSDHVTPMGCLPAHDPQDVSEAHPVHCPSARSGSRCCGQRGAQPFLYATRSLGAHGAGVGTDGCKGRACGNGSGAALRVQGGYAARG